MSAAAQNTVPSTAPLPTHPSPFLYQQSSLSSPSQTCRDYDAESDSSLDFVEREPGPDNGRQRLEEGVRRDWRDRRGVEFPSPPGNPRGRTKSRGRAILDSDPEDIVDETQPPEPVQDNAKRRHMSLSPLRTFFPYRPMGVFDRALSAHPSPNSSPYSSNSSSPFLSTTSLKMTMSTTSFSTSMRSENFLSRKFLSSFKGKERVASNESWDDWEEITVQEAPPVLTSPVARKEKISVRPQTLPNGDRPLTSGTTPETPTTPAETAVSSGSQSPHPLSLRDRKAPPVPFVSRPVRRPAPPPPVLNPVATPLGPIVTSVRTRKANPPPPPPKKKPQVIGASPLGRTLTDEADSESSSILQRALVTPLPLTPIDARHFEYGSITPITPTSERLPGPNFPSALTPVGPSPLSLTTLNRAPGQNTLPALIEPPNETLNYPILETPTEEGSTTLISPSDGAQSFRRHYPGRPLPRPPGTTRAVVDSVYASRYNPQASGTGSALSTCPEGLLIDFGDASLAVSETNAQDHPWNDSLHVPFSATASMSSVELSGSTLDDPFSLPLDAPTPSTPAAETPTTQSLTILPATQITTAPPTVQAPTPVSTGPFSEITDLDVLVSRLDEEHRNGSNYDVSTIIVYKQYPNCYISGSALVIGVHRPRKPAECSCWPHEPCAAKRCSATIRKPSTCCSCCSGERSATCQRRSRTASDYERRARQIEAYLDGRICRQMWDMSDAV